MRRTPVLVVLALAAAACTGGTGNNRIASTVPTSTPLEVAATLSLETTSTVASLPSSTDNPSATTTSTTVPLPQVIQGWTVLDVPAEVFGHVTITGSVEVGGRLVVIGCGGWEADGSWFPIWTTEDLATWRQSTGPAKVGRTSMGCLSHIVSTPFGLFAHGLSLLRSVDGAHWLPVELRSPHDHSLGTVRATFVVGDRLTVLLARAAEAETTVATLLTTTDGETWTQGSVDAAALFDNASVAQVIEYGSQLVAVGASPGGEFVPTAAAWTSPDGLSWELVTPRGEGFEEAYMAAVLDTGAGLVAVGGSPFDTSLLAIWFSPDGREWRRQPSPTGEVAAEHGFLAAGAVTRIAEMVYAAGGDFDAARPSGWELPALWSSGDGAQWERVDLETLRGVVPFTISGFGHTEVGFWPPPRWADDEPVLVLIGR